MGDASRGRVARPRIRRRLLWMGLGLVLLPTLALLLIVGEVMRAERQARVRDLAEHRQRLQQRVSALARSLARHPEIFPEAPPERFALGLDHPGIGPGVEVDGRCDDWRPATSPGTGGCEAALLAYDRPEYLSHDTGAYDPRDFAFFLAAARQDAYLHLFVRVVDDQLAPRGRHLDEGDHLRLAVAVPEPGEAALPRRFVVSLGPEGSVTTYQVDRSWRREEPAPRRIAWGEYRRQAYRRPYGRWHATAQGYDVELRLPLRTLGPGWREAELGLAAVDVDVRPELEAGHHRQEMWAVPRREGALALASPDAERFRAAFARLALDLSGRRLAVFDARGRELLSRLGPSDAADPVLRERVAALRRAALLEGDPRAPDGAPSLAAARVASADGEALAVVIEADASLPPPPALASVLAELPTTAAALAAALVLLFLLLGTTRRLSRRILALVDDVGADRDADDEIGELSRRLSELVERDRAHRGYLEQLPRILAHETLGPLGVIKMAVDELSAGDLRGESARRAVRSIEDLIEDLREATSLEEALRRGERIHVDLPAFLRDYAAAWQEANDAPLALDLPDGALRIEVVERRLEQLLDKLLENARDFSDGRPIAISLAIAGDEAVLRVENRGSRLPPGVPALQLFAPMSSWRKRTTERHLGLGLYVARLVAEQHGGGISAWNDGEDRVVFEVRLARRGREASPPARRPRRSPGTAGR